MQIFSNQKKAKKHISSSFFIDSSSFACMIEESTKYAKQNPLQSCNGSSHFSVFV